MDKETKKKQIKLSIIISLSVILIPAIIIGIVEFKQDLDKKKQIAAEEARLAAQVEVPNVIGMKVDEAKKALNDIGLEINIHEYDKKLTDEKPDEYVVEKQYPSAKEKVDPNTEVKVFFTELKMIESNNFYGMRFKKTIADFCEIYNKHMETVYDYLGDNKAAIGLDTIKESDFSYYMTVDATKCKEYVVNKIGYSIVLFTEPDSDYIVYACVGFDANKVADSSKRAAAILQKEYPATVMSLTGRTYSSVMGHIENILKDAEKNNGVCILFKDNAVYHFTNDGNLNYFYIYAMSEDRYKQLMSGETESYSSSDDQETSNNTTLQETNPSTQKTENIELDSNNYIEIDMPDFIGKTNTEMIFRYNLKEYIVEKLYEQDLEGTTFNLDILKYLDEGTAEIQGKFTLYGMGKVTRQSPSENSTIKIFYDGDGNVKLGEDIKVFCDKATEKSETTELEINRK